MVERQVCPTFRPALIADDGMQDRAKMPSYGTDIMRLWAAAVDYTSDASIGSTSLSAAAEKMRKIRNVMKFLLGNSVKQGGKVKGVQEVSLNLVSLSSL